MRRGTDGHWLARCVRRGQPLLGTLVTLLLEPLSDAADDQRDDDAAADRARLHAAAAAAFAAVAHVGRVMSAHCAASDLGRLARIESGCTTTITLDPRTVHVLRAAQHWQRLSTGAFDPQAAARPLAAAGLRPALTTVSIHASGRLGQLRFAGIDQVLTDGPLALDLGGIAKGYAVDLAVETLQQHGVTSGLVNAGGDMSAFGPRRWPIGVASRGLARAPIDGPRTLCNAALATSETGWHGSELIATARLGSRLRARRGLGHRDDTSRCCTVQATDCISADAFTKWALQADSRAASIRLKRVLRANRATLWRST
ncbi:MAG: FAD:protein FMN transferase [Burkholderiaceae bacterium]